MDLSDVWEQNKRWILGVVAGLLVFWIATTIVGSIYNGAAAERKARGTRNSVVKQSFYDQKARNAARESGERLDGAEDLLRRELEFVPDDDFQLAGKGDPDLHFDQVARNVRTRLVDKAQQFAVEMSSSDLEWDAPVGREEIARTLMGLAVLREGVSRLLDASDEVRAENGNAIGVQMIDKFEISKKGRKSNRRRRRAIRRGVRSGGKRQLADAQQRVDEFEVSFKFRADAATTALFLEKCRAISPVVLLQDGFKMKDGREPDDPLIVTGSLVGLTVRDA